MLQMKNENNAVTARIGQIEYEDWLKAVMQILNGIYLRMNGMRLV
jgi:hypothetical protein